MQNELKKLINDGLSDTITIRHQLHQIPELKYEEFKTSAMIANKLKSYGCTITTGIAKTGIIAIIDSGAPGKTVALRADMDALPIHETTNLPYQSQHSNIMHACGHDGHAATLLLVASVLQKMKSQFCGRIKLIFQPAEEGGKGSLAMINEGVLENPTVDAIFGYHNWPNFALGKMGTRIGAILMGTGRFEITVIGKVAHTSMPQNAINPVTVGAKIVTAIEALQKQYIIDGAVVNVTYFESGEIKSGMTETVKITVVYYVENDEILDKIKLDINKNCQLITHANNAKFTIEHFEWHKQTVNTENETKLALITAKECLGNNEVINFAKPQIAAEDFSEYLRRVPGCFFLIGAGENSPQVHTEKFDFPDSIIANAALVMSQTAINFLNM